ncbi:MAG: response regulator transcription factor [Chitinophagales bacterium]
MVQEKILLVEDDDLIAEAIMTCLCQEGYQYSRASTFLAAEDLLMFQVFDLVLLDITLPGGNGLQLIPTIKRQDYDTGIILLTAKNSVQDKIVGLETGADDYLAKPFHLAELNARIKALLRRQNSQSPGLIHFHEITIEPVAQLVRVNETEVPLTKKEYELLLFFINNKNRMLTKEAILAHLWGDITQDGSSVDYIYTHIKNLRRKLAQGGCPDYLQSKYGLGYKLAE